MRKYDYISILILLALNTSVFSQATREETMNQPVDINTPATEVYCDSCKRTVVIYAFSYTEPGFNSTSVAKYLNEHLLGDECYAVKAYGEEPKPEYVFSLRFEASPDGKFLLYTSPEQFSEPRTTSDHEVIKSVMTCILYYVGGDPSITRTYQDPFNPLTTVSFGDHVWSYNDRDTTRHPGICRPMLDNMIMSMWSLREVLHNFEAMPASCTIHPQKEYVAPGEEIEIIIDNFRDKKGRIPSVDAAKRINVSVGLGEILNDDCSRNVYEPHTYVWDYHDIRVNDNKLIIKYKAPNETCTEDIIVPINSCEIRKPTVVPIEKSWSFHSLGLAEIRIKCYSPWSGTVMYERNISWKDKQPTEYGYIEYTRQLTESATLNLTFGYTHTYTDTETTEEYYDNLIRAQGTYNCTVMNTELMVDEKDGSWNKIEERATGNGNLEDVGGFMTLNYDTGKYTLNLDFTSPEITGKTVITSDKGVTGEDTFTYMFNGYGTEFEEKMKENQITGSWSLPSGKNQVVTGATGNVPGAKFNWSFGR